MSPQRLNNLLHNRNFRNALQMLSLAIICCTLVIYQVTSAVREKDHQLYAGGLIIEQEEANGTAQLLHDDTRQWDSSGRVLDNSVVNKRAVRDQETIKITSNSHRHDSQAVSNNNNNNFISTAPVTFHSHPPKLVVDNVFLSVKSTKRFHQTRLQPVLKTWFNFAKEQTWIFTDADDPELEVETNGHIINTHCPATHYRQALCCKMSQEFDAFLRTSKSWFCHFDDDNYVNVPALLELLGKYNHWEDWYLGKPSLKGPIHIPNPANRTQDVSFWFATGGAGFCISRALALRMSPLARGGKFIKVCDRIQLPDDVTVGYIVGHLLGQNLTVIPQFHSHFETMKFIDMKNAHSEITFSYVRYDNYENILDVKGFKEEEDPTRFLSLHCQLYPNFSYCINR